MIRGGFGVAYQRPGMSDFTGVFGANQGIQVTLQRDNTNTPLPILLRDNPTLPNAPGVSYPLSPTITNNVNAFDSNLQIPYTQSYTVGWQRKLGRDTALRKRLLDKFAETETAIDTVTASIAKTESALAGAQKELASYASGLKL